LYGELYATSSLKESAGPHKKEGMKNLLSEWIDGFLVLAQDQNQKKE